MKNLLTACLPALALFALGGCASTSAISSSEDDGVYYSSKDRTTAVVAPAPAPASTDEAANPDYNGNAAPATARQGRTADQYYDNTYSYMRGVPGYGPGLRNYSPYSPYATLSYPAYSSYGWGGGYCGYSPYATGFYDPFFGPSFYSPYYGYGSGISISIGFGYGYGYGQPYGYGRPYGYGYGGGFYDPFYYSSPFYGGYYGRGGYYGNNYYGGNYGGGNYGGGNYGGNGYYGNGYHSDNGRYRTSGHRSDRATDGRYSTGGVSSPAPGTSSTGGGRVRPNDGLLAPTPAGTLPITTSMNATGEGRTRGDAVTATPAPTTMQPAGQAAARADEPFNRPRRMDRAEQPRYRNMDAPGRAPLDATPDRGRDQTTGDPNQGQATRDERRPMRDDNRGRWRTEAVPQGNDQLQPAAAPQPQESGRRRGGFYQNPEQPRDNGEQAPEQPRQRNDEQPRQQRTYEQPRQPMYEQPQQRTYEQPQQRTYEQPQQRTYEQPQQRTYEQPQQSEMRPSYSAPANNGGNEGGGGHSRGRND